MDIICYADISYITNIEDIMQGFPDKRKEYLNSISFYPRKKQSVLVWALFEKTLSRINLDINDFDFDVTKEGEWFEKKNQINFSLSHSGNIVCVAVSKNNLVAIDVEKCSDKLLGIEKIFSQIQADDYHDKIRLLAKKWTERECLIKDKNSKFVDNYFVFDEENKEYCITVSSNVLNKNKKEIIKINID